MTPKAPTQLQFPKDHILTVPDQPVDDLYLIRSGSVAAQTADMAQAVVFGPGSVIGLVDLIEGRESPRFHALVKTLQPVDVDALDPGDVAQQIAALSPKLRTCLVAMLRSGIRILEANEQTEARIQKVMHKARVGLDSMLHDHARPVSEEVGWKPAEDDSGPVN